MFPATSGANNGRTGLPAGSGFRGSGSINSSSSNTSMKLGPSKKKKMVIKPFKTTPKLPESFEEETWNKLHAAVVAVQNKQTSALSREELYRSVEDMCTWKMAASLYEKLEATCATFIQSRVEQLQSLDSADSSAISSSAGPSSSNATGESVFLDAMYTLWDDHCDDMLVIRTIFMYLDRTFVVHTPHIATIWEMGLSVLRREITLRKQVENKLLQGLLDLIDKERKGEVINRMYLHHLVRMLLSLQLYHSKFEIPFLDASETFYIREGIAMSSSCDVSHFLSHVEKRIQEENDRILNYLDVSTKKQLIYLVETKLLAPHTDMLLEKGFEQLMEMSQKEDLKRMFTLYTRVQELAKLKLAFSQYIKKKVSALVLDLEQESKLVEKLLFFKKQVDEVVCESFGNDPEFLFALKSAMEFAINVRASRPAELVAKFVDAKLRVGNKSGSETEVEQILDHVMVLFRYIQGKDVFEAFYKKDLAKRLLVGKSASFDLEKLMLSKLKTECGSSFTNKLEGMFKDIDLSQSVMTQFQQHAPSKLALSQLGRGALDMHVQVLTTGFWPPYAAVDLSMPACLVPLKDIFEKFYGSKYQGRQLQWQHSLAHCLVKANFPSGKKEFLVSLFQTVVLLCFNTQDEICFKDLKEQTRIEDGELRRTLQSLACGKVRVLQKQPKGKEIGDDDVFIFQKAFTNQLYRIKINSIQLKETKKEQEDTHERVFRDRQYQVDAAIVRIMKARKKLSHQLLMTEIFEQVKFPAKAADVKRRIESLIDREYLERDPANAQMYNYLA